MPAKKTKKAKMVGKKLYCFHLVFKFTKNGKIKNGWNGRQYGLKQVKCRNQDGMEWDLS